MLCLCFGGGAVVGYFWPVVRVGVLALLAVPAVFLAARYRIIAYILLCATCLLLGWWRGGAYRTEVLRYAGLNGQKVTVVAIASDDAVYGTASQLTFEAGHIVVNGRSMVGTMQISGFGVPMVFSGDEVRAQGKIFVARGNDVARISYAQVAVLKKGSSPLDNFRRHFAAGMQTALPEPLASFAMGLLVGQRNTLPIAVSQQLQMVGLTHIIAVSGYNLTIIVHATKRLLGKRSKYQYIATSVALVLCFLAIAGLSPSMVRAAVVCGLGLATWSYGRELKPSALLALSAAITIAFNPQYAWNNVSWTLSFLAFFGVLIVSPIATKRLFGGREPPMVLAIVIESLSAEIMTMPYILLIFGQASLVSTLANVLVAAFIPLAMLLAAFSAFTGMWLPILAGVIAWPAVILLTYMLDVVTLLSKVPHAYVQNVAFPISGMVMAYIAALFICLVAWRHGARVHKMI